MQTHGLLALTNIVVVAWLALGAGCGLGLIVRVLLALAYLPQPHAYSAPRVVRFEIAFEVCMFMSAVILSRFLM